MTLTNLNDLSPNRTQDWHTFHLCQHPPCWALTSKTGFPGGSDGKESACNVGDLGLIIGSCRSPGEGNGYPLQYSCLENPMDRSLEGYSPWGHKESDTTDRLSLSHTHIHTAASYPNPSTLAHSSKWIMYFPLWNTPLHRLRYPPHQH